MAGEIVAMAEVEIEKGKAALPADYVSIRVLRERWQERQRIEEERKNRKCEGGVGREKGKGKVVERETRERREKVYGVFDGERMHVGRRIGNGGGRFGGRSEVGRRIGVEGLKGCVTRWLYDGEGSKGYGDRRVYVDEVVNVGGEGRKVVVGGDGNRRRFGAGFVVDKGGNVVGGKGYGNRTINEEVHGGRDSRGFGKGSSVVNGKGLKNEAVDIGMKFGDLDIRGDDRRGVGKGDDGEVVKGYVGDVKVLEGLGEMSVKEKVEIGRKFGTSLRNGGRKGNVKYGRYRLQFGEVPWFVGKDVVGKQNVVDLREGSEVVKGNAVDVMKENVVDGKVLEVSRGYGYKGINEDADVGRKFGGSKINGNVRKGKFRYGGERRRFQSREERVWVAPRKDNEVEKPIVVAVRGGNEVDKRNLVDVKISETSKGFGYMRGNKAIGGKFGGSSNTGWRKGNVKHGRDHGRFKSRKNKQEESGMMWVKKSDAGAEKQAQVEPDV